MRDTETIAGLKEYGRKARREKEAYKDLEEHEEKIRGACLCDEPNELGSCPVHAE